MLTGGAVGAIPGTVRANLNLTHFETPDWPAQASFRAAAGWAPWPAGNYSACDGNKVSSSRPMLWTSTLGLDMVTSWHGRENLLRKMQHGGGRAHLGTVAGITEPHRRRGRMGEVVVLVREVLPDRTPRAGQIRSIADRFGRGRS